MQAERLDEPAEEEDLWDITVSGDFDMDFFKFASFNKLDTPARSPHIFVYSTD